MAQHAFWLGGGLAMAASLIVATPSAAQDASEAQLYAAAKLEPSLNWYQVPLSQGTGERVAAAFSNKYPGLQVLAQRAPAQTFFQKVTQEIQAGVPGADVFTSSVTGHLAALKQQGQLLQYTPKSVATMLDVPGIKGVDPDGYYFGTILYLVTLVYNTRSLAAADAPHTLADLADPKWSGKVALPNPGTSGTFGILTVQMAKTYGFDFFSKLAANRAIVVRSLPDVIATVQSGEAPIGVAPASMALDGKAHGQPIDVIYQSDGVMPAISVTGILKKTRSPNTAKLFMEFLHSSDMSRVVAAEYNEPLHADVAPAPGAEPLASVKIVLPSDAEVDAMLPKVVHAWRDAFGM